MGKRTVILLMLLLTFTIQVNASELCTNEISKDILEITKIYNPESPTETMWTWAQDEEITIEVEIKNKNLTSRDFQLKLFLLDQDLQTIENFTTTDIDPLRTFSLDNNTNLTVNFTFSPKEQTSETYFLYAQLFDTGNETICAELKAKETGQEAQINIEGKERMVLVRKIYGPETVTVGSQVEYTAEIVNLGEITEEKVSIIIFNKAFNIREEKETTNLLVGQSQNITFNFTIPSNYIGEQEILLFGTEYNYNNVSKLYEGFPDKDKALTIQITANQTITTISIINETTPEAPEATPKNITITPVTTEAPESTEEESSSTFFWTIIIIAIILVLIIILVAITYLKKKEDVSLDPLEVPKVESKINTYLSKINSTTPSIFPNKPSETNTANTNIPPTSQSPPQQPRSPLRPTTTSSSPKPTPSKPASPLPTYRTTPQTNQPSPPNPAPNKPSSP